MLTGIFSNFQTDLIQTWRVFCCLALIFSGTITSSYAGEGLPGANIIEKGTLNGTVYDLNGKYSVAVGASAIRVIGSIGFLTEKISVNGRSAIDIVLVHNIQAFEEIVVIGYGTVKKKDLTGAVVQIDATEIAHQSPNFVTGILRTNVQGLNVGFSNSPKGVSQSEVRGKSTLTAGGSPLIVADLGGIYDSGQCYKF